MNDFSYTTALTIFFTYVAIDMLYAWYIMSVNKKRAFTAAILTAIIYSLLAFGVYANSGCWTEKKCTYLEITNGSIELKTFI